MTMMEEAPAVSVGTPMSLARAVADFAALGARLGYTLQFEHELSAMQRLMPNIPGAPLRGKMALHLLKDRLQTGIYCSLEGALPSRTRLMAARAVYKQLHDILSFSTDGFPADIQSVAFLDAVSGVFHLAQYWIDYPGAHSGFGGTGYAFRRVEGSLDTVLSRLARANSVDLTGIMDEMAKQIRPALTELSVMEWEE